MYAIVKTGGKQIKVSQGDKLRVERLDGDAGAKVKLEEVLLLDDNGTVTVGTPFIDGAFVEGKIVDQIRDRKVRVFKKKRRQGYRNTKGHRQHLTVLEITGVNGPNGKKAASTTAAKATKSAESKPADKKATTAKPTTAKKPAAKSATAKTAAKKPAAKKTAAKKTAETKADKK